MSDPVFEVLPGPSSVEFPQERARGLRYALPFLLLVLTFFTTVLVGARLQFNFDHHLEAFAGGDEMLPLFPVHWLWDSPRLLLRGIPFSLAIMGILLAHELGHYVYCVRNQVKATLPFFIPAPTLIGTLGAFIRIGSFIRSRAALFDIGIAGPIAGFVVALPVTVAGLAWSRPLTTAADPEVQFGFPLIFELCHRLLHPGGPALAYYYLHPVALAGWAGMLATALNLLPGGQLDGGHIVFSVSPTLHKLCSWAVVAGLVAMAWYCWVGWMIWAIMLALSGLQQPSVPLWPGVGRGRRWMALLALALLLLTLSPAPVLDKTFPQVAHAIKHGEF